MNSAKKDIVKDIHYLVGIPELYRNDAVALFDSAFGPKFSVAIKDKSKRLQFLRDSLWLSSAVGAIADNKLVGIAGFSAAEGSLTKGITGTSLFKSLGVIRGVWAVLIFSLYERKALSGELLMDGIVVCDGMRGYGIGTKLLDHIKLYGVQKNYPAIRLDVIDTNNDAKRLYEKRGFEATETNHFGYLRWLLGFGASTTMTYRIK